MYNWLDWEALLEIYFKTYGRYASWQVLLIWGQTNGLITKSEATAIIVHAIRYGW